MIEDYRKNLIIYDFNRHFTNKHYSLQNIFVCVNNTLQYRKAWKEQKFAKNINGSCENCIKLLSLIFNINYIILCLKQFNGLIIYQKIISISKFQRFIA